MKRGFTLATLAAVAAVAACNGDKSENAVTPEESAGLNNAADMLDASPDSLVANDEVPLGNGEEAVPADEGAAANGAQ